MKTPKKQKRISKAKRRWVVAADYCRRVIIPIFVQQAIIFIISHLDRLV
ncbi:hypothetical protein [Mesorhizobium sp. M0800]